MGKIFGDKVRLYSERESQHHIVRLYEESVHELPIEMTGFAFTPAATHLFEVRKSGVNLKASEAELFQHKVAELSFLCK